MVKELLKSNTIFGKLLVLSNFGVRHFIDKVAFFWQFQRVAPHEVMANYSRPTIQYKNDFYSAVIEGAEALGAATQ